MTREEIENKVAELYVGILGRAPDSPGLTYWAAQIEQGVQSLENTRASFATPDQPEYWDTYGGLTNTELVNAIYNNYLERSPDASGLEYWVGELDSGAVQPDQMINAIINAVQDPAATAAQTLIDATVLENKVEAALYFTAQAKKIMSPDSAFFEQAKAVVSDVNDDASTVEASKAASDDYIDGLPDSAFASIVGKWALADPDPAGFVLEFTFESDGTYLHYQDNSEDIINNGGETGTFQWDEASGTLTHLSVTSDENDGAGLSHPSPGEEGPYHIDFIGNTMTITDFGLTLVAV